jgi:3-hydroxyacyl-[acyl-carrier-protein] dehydratase
VIEGPAQSPAAAPLRAVDRVLRLDESGITTRKAVAGNEPFFPGHYPDYFIYPGVFIIEAVQQAAQIYARRHVGQVKLVEVRSARFLSALLPGAVLDCDCKCTLLPEGKLRVDATCRHGEVTAATVKLVYQVEDALAP